MTRITGNRIRAYSALALLLYAMMAGGCVNDKTGVKDIASVRIIMSSAKGYEVRSSLPDEELIHDVNLFLFDGKNRLEDHIYARRQPDLVEKTRQRWSCRRLRTGECFSSRPFAFKG